jgi:hypothetical protein
LAGEIADLAGGAATLADRAEALADAGRTRLAAHLIELASTASPASLEIQAVRAKVYAQCTAAETSLIGRAIFDMQVPAAFLRSQPLSRSVSDITCAHPLARKQGPSWSLGPRFRGDDNRWSSVTVNRRS